MKVLLQAAEPRPHAVLTDWLRSAGHEYRDAYTPGELWAPDVVVLWLPRLIERAEERCAELRHQVLGATTRLLAVGSWSTFSDVQRIVESGADDYLVWPTDETAFRLRLLVLENERTRHPLTEDQRQLQIRLSETQKAESLATLAGTIAHDFNNLLAAILGNTELAMLDLTPQSSIKYSLEQIEKASRRAAELTRQMLTYSVRASLDLVPVNVTRLVEEIAELLRSSIGKKCTIEYQFGRGLPPIKGEPAHLRQVAMNLLINASEAMGDRHHGRIVVRTSLRTLGPNEFKSVGAEMPLPPGRYVSLSVTDNGQGMDPETVLKVFDPFFTTKKTGRGLGLAAVQGILRSHHGGIQVESNPGNGSTFEVLLPAAQSEESAPETDLDILSAWNGSGMILLIDDEEAVREAARRLLEKAGYTVLAAHDGEQGLEVFRDFCSDISAIILDLSMPGMDGLEVFREIHASHPDMHVIVWSGFDEEDVSGKLAAIGRCTFIEKPSHVRELALALKQALAPSTA